MDIKDLCNAGGDILDAVVDAVNRNDYTGLSDQVSSTVNRVAGQLREDFTKGSFGEPTHQYGKTVYKRQGQKADHDVHSAGSGKYSSIYKENESVSSYKKDAKTSSYHSGKGEASSYDYGKSYNYGKENTSSYNYGKEKASSYTRNGKYSSVYNRKGNVFYQEKESSQVSQPQKSYKPYHSYKSLGRQLPNTVTSRPAGRIVGHIQFVWGILATSGFGITAIVMAALLIGLGGATFGILFTVFFALTVLSVADIVRGNQKIGLVNRFYRYVDLIGSRGFIAIEELARQTGRKKEDVLRDLKKMMNKHMFLQGRLDHNQTTFMLTQEAYQQYMMAERGRRDREAEEAARQAAQEAKGVSYDKETEKILKEGSDYIRMVHECNEKIASEEMSAKLSRLEAIVRRIFEQVEKDPDSADDLHKFLDYYLPTTTKLLHAYIDLDRQEIAGENITATKKEIEDTLDTVNAAFERLLDSLFEDTAWDISSDISVMKTMMAQEGLTGSGDFKVK